jgi:hypothetical protein
MTVGLQLIDYRQDAGVERGCLHDIQFVSPVQATEVMSNGASRLVTAELGAGSMAIPSHGARERSFARLTGRTQIEPERRRVAECVTMVNPSLP